MNNENALVPFEKSLKDIIFKRPDPLSNTNKTHVTRILNAYNQTTYFDSHGVIWIESTRLADILRTNKANAKYIISNEIEDKSKQNIGGKIYVVGYEIKKIIDKFIQETGVGTKKQYLKYSEMIFNAIRDCDTAQNMRAVYQNQLQGDVKKLKKKRIRKYRIKNDELTGEELIEKTSEFSHIRSYALFKDISDKIDNGLIVNKEIHNIISQKGINDEEELLILRKERNWNIRWYNKYKLTFM
ncbi:hypothetical protein U728_911 [Clostridium botulinum 202F]|nr:hypothetical protein U728_911 [Clostridium botulinum 202F]KAI3346097.1 hypothetical protein CIT17_11000 [Clostridium botulinum]MBY6987701.1 hypothetical protein [Clostridium botulinum]NFH01298.1 hypothetical protein [Clostridium botulinum]NFP39430.1 hypothetical protein [Clostridium botulinum]